LGAGKQRYYCDWVGAEFFAKLLAHPSLRAHSTASPISTGSFEPFLFIKNNYLTDVSAALFPQRNNDEDDTIVAWGLSYAMAELNIVRSLLDQIPALPPPPGVQSNFDSPITREGLGRILVALTYGLMLAFLVLRIYTRLNYTGALGVDDCE
jgi:hypothetical protein